MSEFVKGYMVQANNGFLWDFGYESFKDTTEYRGDWITTDRATSDRVATENGGHVLTIVDGEKYVPEDEVERNCTKLAIGCETLGSVWACVSGNAPVDDFLRAKINGIAPVPKPKRYLLPLEGTEYHNLAARVDAKYYVVKAASNWRPDGIAVSNEDAIEHGFTVSESDLANRPAWAMAIEPVEVTD